MKKVHQFGNEFWIEGDWTDAAKVGCDRSLRDGSITFSVSFGSHGSSSSSEQRLYGQAIIAACDYANLCPELFKDKSRDEIRAEWDDEIDKFYRGLYKTWNPGKVVSTIDRKALRALKDRVLNILAAAQMPDIEGKTLAQSHLKVLCNWKGKPSVWITGKGSGRPHLGYGSHMIDALGAAGLKIVYGLENPCTEGRYVGGTYVSYIEIPLDQINGIFGYDCA